MSESDDTKSGAVPVTEGAPRADPGIESDKPAGNPEAPSGSRRIAWTFLVVIIVVVFAAGFLSAVALAPRLAGLLPWTTTADATAASADAEKLAAVAANLSALEQRLADLETRTAADAGKQAERLDALQATTAQSQAGETEQSAQLGQLREQVDDAVQRLAALEQSAAATDVAVGRMAAIERRLETLAQSGNSDAVAAELLARLEQLEARQAEAPASARSEESDARIQELSNRLEDIAGQVAVLSPVDDGAQTARVDRVESLLAELAGRIDALNVGERSELESGVGLVLAAAALRDATRRYAGFKSELAVVRDMAPGIAAFGAIPVAAALSELEKHAATGAPTVAVLASQFGEYAPRIVRAANRDADAGWIAQTLDRVSQVVSVRRIGDVGGATVEARVARAELRVSAGDLTAAVAELADLSGPAAAAAAPWLQGAHKRLAVDGAAQTVYEAAARSLLAGVPSE